MNKASGARQRSTKRTRPKLKRSDRVLLQALREYLEGLKSPRDPIDLTTVRIPVGWVIGRLWHLHASAPPALCDLAGIPRRYRKRRATCSDVAVVVGGDYYMKLGVSAPGTIERARKLAKAEMDWDRLGDAEKH